MRNLLALCKATLFVTGTLIAYSLYISVLPFIKLTGKRYEPWRNYIMKLWGKISMFSLAVKVNVNGKPPEPPFFLVSNHLSYIDVPLLSFLLKTTYISKYEIRHWPVMGWMASSLGMIFINRRRKRDVTRVNKIISTCIDRYQGVVLFPEGQTSPGHKVLTFKPSLLEHAAREGVEVDYAVIRYETTKKDPPASESVAWAEDISLLNHFWKLSKNRAIKAEISFGDSSILLPDRKILAKELQMKVEQLFFQMHRGQEQL